MRTEDTILDAERHAVGRGERGAVLVEFVLILPLLLLLTFGIIEFSKLYSSASTVSNATRTGARIASAEPRKSGFADDTADAVSAALSALPGSAPQDLWVYKATSGGLPDQGDFSHQCNQCVIYQWDPAAKAFDTKHPVKSNWGYLSQNACAGNSDYIGVYATAKYTFDVPYFGASKMLSSKTVMRLEPMPVSQICS